MAEVRSGVTSSPSVTTSARVSWSHPDSSWRLTNPGPQPRRRPGEPVDPSEGLRQLGSKVPRRAAEFLGLTRATLVDQSPCSSLAGLSRWTSSAGTSIRSGQGRVTRPRLSVDESTLCARGYVLRYLCQRRTPSGCWIRGSPCSWVDASRRGTARSASRRPTTVISIRCRRCDSSATAQPSFGSRSAVCKPP